MNRTVATDKFIEETGNRESIYQELARHTALLARIEEEAETTHGHVHQSR
jgi:hypothetical protein